MTRTEEMVALHEGWSDTIYRCPAGARTIGYGHNLEANPLPDVAAGITRERGRAILRADVRRVTAELLEALPWFEGLDEVRQAVLTDMAFNLGTRGLLLFQRTLRFCREGEYAEAAREMISSKWAAQVGDRARRLADMMRFGDWPKEVRDAA